MNESEFKGKLDRMVEQTLADEIPAVLNHLVSAMAHIGDDVQISKAIVAMLDDDILDTVEETVEHWRDTQRD